MRACLAVHVAVRTIAIFRSAVATNFGPSTVRSAARRFYRANVRYAGAATVHQWTAQGAYGAGATRIDATCGVRNEGAAIVPRVGAAIGPSAAVERANAIDARRSRTRRGHRRAGAADAMRSIVDGAVAIVVDGITTHLGARLNRLRTIEIAGRANQLAGGAGPLFTRYVAIRSTTRIAFIRLPVAVVVDIVARFGRRLHRLRTIERSILANRRANGARPYFARHIAHRAARLFVRCAIAIVVDAVAHLGLRHSGGTRLHHTTGTRGNRRHATTNTAREDTQSIVDEEIAIVIDAITGFRLGLSRRTRLRHTIHTCLDGRQTRARAARRLRNVFVAHAVAIVIFAVARLHRRKHFALAWPPGHIRTRLRTGLAFAYAHGAITTRITRAHFAFGGTRTIDSIVDLAIAIFIRAVASFRHRISWCTGRNHSLDASIDRDLASAHATSNRLKAFVDLAIAINVGAIAGFGPGQDFTRTRAPFSFGTRLHTARALPHSLRTGWARITRLRGSIGAAHASTRSTRPITTLTTGSASAPGTSWARRRRSRVSATKRQRAQKN